MWLQRLSQPSLHKPLYRQYMQALHANTCVCDQLHAEGRQRPQNMHAKPYQLQAWLVVHIEMIG